MDIQALISNFLTPSGDIKLPPHLTLAGMFEMMYVQGEAQGHADDHSLRFWDYSQNPEGEPVDFTRREINVRVKAVAARLQQVGKVGDRVAILAGNSPEYLFSFLGAQYAAMIPVPLYDPNEPGHSAHLRAVLADAQPSTVLTTKASASTVRTYFSEIPAADRPRVVAVDALPDTLAESYENPAAAGEGFQASAGAVKPLDAISFLQYTSGSTRTPAGVVLTNRSIITNVIQMAIAADLGDNVRMVSWLPMHHDMGMIFVVLAIGLGKPMELMTPRDFIQRPGRWVAQLADRDDTDAHVYTVVPNFALELASQYGAPKEGQSFKNVEMIVVGSEPVSKAASQKFLETMEPHGLRRKSLSPSYGLAEAALAVAMPQTDSRPVLATFDRERLAEGRAVRVDENVNGVDFVSNGQAVPNLALTIVDPATRTELPDGHVGEIWAHGENNAVGYLGRAEDTEETFGNTLETRLEEGSRVDGSPEHRWLATGDLGVILDGELYITGRLKDLIVVAGRNHYPQDIEATVQEATEHVRKDSVAAFAVPGDDVEKLILFVERADGATEAGDAEAIELIRGEVAAAHGVTPADIRFFAPMDIARSSSGKIARRVNQKRYLES